MSEISNRIDTILAKNKLRRIDLARATGLGESTIRSWVDKKPTAEKLYPVAQFLGVSMEYLVTGVEPAPSDKLVLNDKERELIEIFRHLDNRDQTSVFMLAQGLESQYSDSKVARISDA